MYCKRWNWISTLITECEQEDNHSKKIYRKQLLVVYADIVLNLFTWLILLCTSLLRNLRTGAIFIVNISIFLPLVTTQKNDLMRRICKLEPPILTMYLLLHANNYDYDKLHNYIIIYTCTYIIFYFNRMQIRTAVIYFLTIQNWTYTIISEN